MKNKVLIASNLLLALYILYRLTIGEHIVWYADNFNWGGPPTGSYKFSTFLVLTIYVSVILPVIIALRSKNAVWLLQSILTVVCMYSWKTDTLQRTLFYYSPLSTYRQIKHSVKVIENKEALLEQFIALANNEIAKNSGYFPQNQLEFSKNAAYELSKPETRFKDTVVQVNGEPVLEQVSYKMQDTLFYMEVPENMATALNYKVRVIEVRNNKIYSCTLCGGGIFYPNGMNTEKYSAHNKNFYKPFCASKTYHYGNKWLIYVGSYCQA